MADEKEKAQVKLILEAYKDTDEVGVFPETWEREGQTHLFLFRKGAMLVPDSHATVVIKFLARRVLHTHPRALRSTAVLPGLTHISYREARPTVQVWTALEQLDRRFGPGLARPVHLMHAVGYGCSADEPEPEPPKTQPIPRVATRTECRCHRDHGRPRCDGAGVRVELFDTGINEEAIRDHDWTRGGVTGDVESAAVGQPLTYEEGHGTFSAGVLRAAAPEASVHVTKVLDRVGTAFEDDVVRKMAGVLSSATCTPDILLVCFATQTRLRLPLHSFEALHENVIRHIKGVVVLAPAGNDGNCAMMAPASLPWVVSVGALTTNGERRAGFSNYGGWVDVYAPGEGLVNAFPKGRYTTKEPPAGTRRTFKGMAKWSGTSFATPLVAGVIAGRMSAHAENGRRAADEVLRLARHHAVPGVGAVVLPDMPCCSDHASP